MEMQCFSLQLEFISPGIFLGTALDIVMLICEKKKKALYKGPHRGGQGVVSDRGEL